MAAWSFTIIWPNALTSSRIPFWAASSPSFTSVMPPWAAASIKSLSAVESVVAAFARGTSMRSPTATRVMPSVADAELEMSFKNRVLSCSTACVDPVLVFISDCLVNVGLVLVLVLAWNLRRSRHKKLGEDLIALPGEGEIFFGESAFIMRGERQRHLVKTNINIRMVIDFLSFPVDSVDESDALQKS